jgi:hypothetical protein
MRSVGLREAAAVVLAIGLVTGVGIALSGRPGISASPSSAPIPSDSIIPSMSAVPSLSAAPTIPVAPSESAPQGTPSPDPPPTAVSGCGGAPRLAGEWSRAAPFLGPNGQVVAGRVVNAVALPPDHVLVFPEGESSEVAIYSTSTNSWRWVRPEVVPPYGTGSETPFVLGADGFVYRFSSGPEWTDVHRYDPARNTWAVLGRFVDPDRLLWVFDAIAKPEGSILLFAPPSEYDPASDTLSRLPVAGGEFRWAEQGPRGTIIGIEFPTYDPNKGFSESRVASFDPETGLETPLGTTPPTDMLGAGVGNGPGGRTYIFGNRFDADDPAEPWAYDHGARTWLCLPPPAMPRVSPLVVGGPDDRLYLIGGSPVPPPDGPSMVEPTVEVFEPAD